MKSRSFTGFAGFPWEGWDGRAQHSPWEFFTQG
jgi:hypothetical protein